MALNSFRNKNKLNSQLKKKKNNINQKNLKKIMEIQRETNYVKKRKREDNK